MISKTALASLAGAAALLGACSTTGYGDDGYGYYDRDYYGRYGSYDYDRPDPRYDHRGGADAVPYEIWAELAEVLPPVGEFAGFTATTSGYYATTPDHNPFLGYDPRRPNLIRLVGFSGHGVMFGPFTALVARELADAGREIETVMVDGQAIPIDAFRIGRPYSSHEAMVI